MDSPYYKHSIIEYNEYHDQYDFWNKNKLQVDEKINIVNKLSLDIDNNLKLIDVYTKEYNNTKETRLKYLIDELNNKNNENKNQIQLLNKRLIFILNKLNEFKQNLISPHIINFDYTKHYQIQQFNNGNYSLVPDFDKFSLLNHELNNYSKHLNDIIIRMNNY